jgi:PhnB protein
VAPGSGDEIAVIPQLTVRDGRAALAFYAAAFGAEERFRIGGTDDEPGVVAELSIGDARFWVSDEAPEFGNQAPASLGGASTRLLLRTGDPDAVQARALEAGAREVVPVQEEHGWRLGRIEDPEGHHWEIGHPLGTWPPER